MKNQKKKIKVYKRLKKKMVFYIFLLLIFFRRRYINKFINFFKLNFLIKRKTFFFGFLKFFCIFLLMFKNFFEQSKTFNVLDRNSTSFFFEQFTSFSLFVSFFYYLRYKIVKIFFLCIIRSLVFFPNLRLELFLASNDTVTAYFLS
jgi:hypothetical protein